MGAQALCCSGCESPKGEEAVPWHGRGLRGDQRRVGSGAKIGVGAHQGAPQGPGNRGPSILDRLPLQGERAAEDADGRPGREAEGGGGIDCDSL